MFLEKCSSVQEGLSFSLVEFPSLEYLDSGSPQFRDRDECVEESHVQFLWVRGSSRWFNALFRFPIPFHPVQIPFQTQQEPKFRSLSLSLSPWEAVKEVRAWNRELLSSCLLYNINFLPTCVCVCSVQCSETASVKNFPLSFR